MNTSPFTLPSEGDGTTTRTANGIGILRKECLSIGMDLFLDVEVRETQVKARTRLIGYQEKRFLIVSWPRLDESPISLIGGQILVVRFMHQGSIYGFHVQVLRVLANPFYLAILDYPESVEEFNMRAAPRLQVIIPLHSSSHLVPRGSILDLSGNGALLMLQQPPQLGAQLSLNFMLPSGTLVQALRCEVQRVEGRSLGHLVGVRFLEGHQDLPAIRQYLMDAHELIRTMIKA
jgi:c-di-GMP-binding flagellar brake protein YcgR